VLSPQHLAELLEISLGLCLIECGKNNDMYSVFILFFSTAHYTRKPLVELEELDDSALEADSGEKMVGEICITFRVVFTGVYSVALLCNTLYLCQLEWLEPRLGWAQAPAFGWLGLMAQARDFASLSPGFEPKPGRNITSSGIGWQHPNMCYHTYIYTYFVVVGT